MKIRYRLVAILLCCSMLLATGCSEPAQQPEETTAKVATEGTEPTEQVADDGSLNSLRQAMVETPHFFAVAYFGYHDNWDSDLPTDPFEAMLSCAPQLCEDLPFLLDIPEDRRIGERGELYCIVPLDPDATVAISKGSWDDSSETYLYEESLYFARSGEPILLFCNGEGWEPDTQVFLSGPSGEAFWYPSLDDNLCAAPLRNDNWESLFYDFSPYREMLATDYRQMVGEWIAPTDEMLCGTTWCWESFNKAGQEVSCQVTFGEETLSVRWDDGIDEEEHEYPDAAWKLSSENGYCVLSIDFREMAGVLRYNLLYHEVYENLYFGMDVVQEEMPIGWEPLHRYMIPPIAPEPVEMLGNWELEWTEVEGYRETVAPGTEHVSVFLNDASGFRISLTDNTRQGQSFKNKELGIYEGELYSGCGNDQWMCYIGYMGPRDIIYSLTLTRDDTLLMQMYWEIDDGVPMVAYKGYRRTQ